ncbi:MAG: HAMP domain-containing protein [Blautia marasmi]
MEEFSAGNLEVTIKEYGNDEIGRMAGSIRSSVSTLKEMIHDITHILSEISHGNLDVTVNGNYIGDLRFIREALEQIIESLNITLGQINVPPNRYPVVQSRFQRGHSPLPRARRNRRAQWKNWQRVSGISAQIAANAESAAKPAKKPQLWVGRQRPATPVCRKCWQQCRS